MQTRRIYRQGKYLGRIRVATVAEWEALGEVDLVRQARQATPDAAIIAQINALERPQDSEENGKEQD